MTLKAEQVAVVPLYAGFWRRGAAMYLDIFILFIPLGIVKVMFQDSPPLAFAATLAAACSYYALFHSSAAQATPGKLAFGIKVTNLAGGRIGLGRGIMRYLETWLSLLPLALGYVMAAFTGKKRALHDVIAGTLVVNRKADPEEVVAGGGTMPLTAGVIVAIVLLFVLPVGGILGAILIPAYSDYTVRVKTNEAIALGSALRTQVDEALATNQPFKVGPVPSGSRNVREAAIAADGTVTVRLLPTVANGGSIVWRRMADETGRLAWRCFSDDIPNRYLPPACRR